MEKIVPSTTSSDVKRFDRWAATYDQSVLQRLYFGPVHSKMVDLLVREGPKDAPSCIIDVGCGTGRLLRTASARWPGAQLLGVDPAEKMVTEATRLNPNAVFKLASAESLPFPDQTADIVLSNLSFRHWADQKKGLQEIVRVLRPGGFFCPADHNVILLAKLFGERVKSHEEIRALITGTGLFIVVQGFVKADRGLLNTWISHLGTEVRLASVAQMSVATVIGSNLFSNVPFVLIASHWVTQMSNPNLFGFYLLLRVPLLEISLCSAAWQT